MRLSKPLAVVDITRERLVNVALTGAFESRKRTKADGFLVRRKILFSHNVELPLLHAPMICAFPMERVPSKNIDVGVPFGFLITLARSNIERRYSGFIR